ncbi:uncharacterized protein EV422DRAFT_588398 [Fimicolochytrium jonesii]|uniref:uncharacterized protein n=1 Tax=Fimicolochytrium jonesii TaxID=1396493 RepID=UPI0022FEC11E|nr:uncharacterized protein EV422DRAFT_588398 [Fimicolochytrium jonesii]KAI8819603.1 hypothetical protein EV422DRAFT_588398 [Fimicolochytrium jonesii]
MHNSHAAERAAALHKLLHQASITSSSHDADHRDHSRLHLAQQKRLQTQQKSADSGFHSIWSGFYKKALRERQNQLRLAFPGLFPPGSKAGSSAPSDESGSSSSGDEGEGNGRKSTPPAPFPLNGLDEQIANNMVENCVGTLGMPIGLGLNFTINSVPTVIPMCVEEPSVVAAASNAAKTITTFGGGFVATNSERNIIYAQIQVAGIDDEDIPAAIERLESKREQIMSLGNQFCENMVSRGGGVTGVTFRAVRRQPPTSAARPHRVTRANCRTWLVVHIHIDVCDAMGANCASAVAEGVAPLISSLTGGTIGLRIVSNLNVERMAKASFRVPVEKLAYKGVSGEDLAFRVVEANEWALSDPFRAATHNKGIMNGIDAVALATGQDWRAIEAAAHAYNAVREDSYRPFTDYWVEEDSNGQRFLRGEIELPMPVATKGGVLTTHPVLKYTLGLMGNPDSKGLGRAMAALGLAQNFAALRALCTEGIQRGHMSLHARNIAIGAGAPSHAIAECVTFMVETGRFNRNAVKEYLRAHEVHHEIRLNGSSDNLFALGNKNSKAEEVLGEEPPPSLFYFEALENPRADGTAGDKVILNVAFQTLGAKPVHIELVPNVPSTKVVRQLFGEKGHAWLSEMFNVLESLKVTPVHGERSNAVFAKKLKLLSVLLNLVIRRLMMAHPHETARFVRRITRARSHGALDSADSLDLAGTETSDSTTPVEAKSSTHDATPSTKTSKIPTSGIFRHRVLLDVDLKRISSTPDAHLSTGFPLVLALWQVFEFHVQQWVGQPRLARALIDEQWRVVLSLINAPVSPPGVSHTEDPFKRVIETHAKRFQSTMFVLCDATTFPEREITPQLVHLLAQIGTALEWNHAVAHDLSPSRLTRDVRDILTHRAECSEDGGLATGVVNVFLMYLTYVKHHTISPSFIASRLGLPTIDAQDVATQVTNESVTHAFTPDISEFVQWVLTHRTRVVADSTKGGIAGDVLDRARVEDALSVFGRFYGAEAVIRV